MLNVLTMDTCFGVRQNLAKLDVSTNCDVCVCVFIHPIFSIFQPANRP